MKPENPPAFPVKVARNTSSDPLATPKEVQLEGMTLRDWFAGQVLAGVAGTMRYNTGESARHLARSCYLIADAMLAAGGYSK